MTEMNETKELSSLDDEIDLKYLLRILWDGKKTILLITSVIAACSVLYALSLENYYRSESILVAAESNDHSSLSQYAGLASLAGVSLPSSGSDSIVEVMEVIKSRDFVKHLITFEGVLPSLIAAKSYNPVTKELSFDPKIYDDSSKTWTREPTEYYQSKPSYLEAHGAYTQGILSISQDKKTGLVKISIEHISPIFAKNFLTLIIDEANSLKRKKDIASSSEALSHLKKELSNTPLVEIKESINQLIKAQLETQTIAVINEEYSLATIEPPFVPEVKSKPNRAILCILITMFGGILSLVVVLMRHYFVGAENKFGN